MSVRNTNALLLDGYECLVEKLGLLEAEKFIYTVKSEHFDYTEWRRDKFDGKSLDELLDEAEEYAKSHHKSQ